MSNLTTRGRGDDRLRARPAVAADEAGDVERRHRHQPFEIAGVGAAAAVDPGRCVASAAAWSSGMPRHRRPNAGVGGRDVVVKAGESRRARPRPASSREARPGSRPDWARRRPNCRNGGRDSRRAPAIRHRGGRARRRPPADARRHAPGRRRCRPRSAARQIAMVRDEGGEMRRSGFFFALDQKLDVDRQRAALSPARPAPPRSGRRFALCCRRRRGRTACRRGRSARTAGSSHSSSGSGGWTS